MNLGIQRKTDLALMALEALPVDGSTMAGAALAESIGTTPTFLPQVIAPLVSRGWVTSERGPGGGYSLTGEALSVSLLDVITAIEGPPANGRCVLRDAPCPGTNACMAHPVWSEARRVLEEGFGSIPAVSNQGDGS